MEPPKDDLSLSRRPLDVEDYIDIARRHKAWILGSTFVSLVVAVVVAFLWPNTYISDAVLRVVPPAVPEKFVAANVDADLAGRIQAMTAGIMSRSSLTNIITTHNLYPADRNRLPTEDLVERLRKSIKVGNVFAAQGRLAAFPISFAYENRLVAQRVTQDLVSRFIDESIRSRATQSLSTTNFLKDQWDDAKRDLDAIEQKVAAFRARNAGRLPDQMQTTMQRIQGMETQLNGITWSINRATQDKLQLESDGQIARTQLSQLMAAIPPEDSSPTRRERNPQLLQTEKEISSVEATLARARERYREAHPDVAVIRDHLASLQARRDELVKQQEQEDKEREKERLAAAASAPARRRVDVAIVKNAQAIEANIAKLQSQVQAKEIEIQELVKQQRKLADAIKSANEHLKINPSDESEYTLLLQDRDLARKRYDDTNILLAKSEVATNRENRKQGESLELLDSASLPQNPAAPKRWLIISMGVCAGLAIGFGLAALREVKDTTLKNLKDVRAYTQLVVLASVPLLENDLVLRRRRRNAILGWSTVILIGCGVMAGSVLYHLAKDV
jgi:polysaccharide chain length determinant protein (PEP-CTERM system associated)